MYHLSPCPVPQPSVTITRSHSGTVYAGTKLVLIVDISFSDLKKVDVNTTLDIKWIRQKSDSSSEYIINDTRTTVSAVSGSESNFKASLTYSPIAVSDSGRHWVNIYVKPSDRSIHIKSSFTAKTHDLYVDGE